MGESRRSAEDHAPEVRKPGGYRRSDADIGIGIGIEVRQGEVTISGVVRHCNDLQRMPGYER